jgi:aldehyde dehydrogenase (NAD+)
MTAATHYIDGGRVASQGTETIAVIDPSDGQRFGEIARGTAADVDAAVRAARRAMGENFDGPWGAMTALERGRLLAKLGAAVMQHHEELAQLEARDTGKALRVARNDATALARYFEYYAGACDKLHGDTLPYERGYTVLTVRMPHGVTGHIIPWNYPMQIAGRSVGASLAAGNACVVKPAEDASLSLLRLAEIATEVGFPAGALNVVTGYGKEAGAALCAHPGIDHISFTARPSRAAASAWRRPSGIAPSRWSSAASRRSSCSPTPISMRPCPCCSTRSSRTPARPARPAAACWSSNRCTKRS